MNTAEPRTKKMFALLFAAALFLGLCAVKAQAQEGLDLNRKVVRGSAILQTWGMPAEQTSCRMASILGMCGSGATAQSGRKAGGWFAGLSLRNMNLSITRLTVKKVVPNKIFQIAKMFIDDVEVAEIGDFKIKLAISFQ